MTLERDDLVESLRRHRGFLVHTARDLTDAQADLRPTVSQLSIGGLIKHVTLVERGWMVFAAGGAETKRDRSEWENGFRMMDGETLSGLLAAYDEVAAETDKLVETLDLDQIYPLPAAPWREPGMTWSVRRVLLHLIAETAQHAGHADIIRESIDGAKTMG
jgi:uncharacterized damage-inducible protein DinB